MNIDVNHNVCSNNFKFSYFIHFLPGKYFVHQIKSIGYYRILPVMNRSILMNYLKLNSCIQLRNQKTKTLNVSSVTENSLKMNDEKFGLNVSVVLFSRTWTLPHQRTQSISVTFINRLKEKIDFV